MLEISAQSSRIDGEEIVLEIARDVTENERIKRELADGSGRSDGGIAT